MGNLLPLFVSLLAAFLQGGPSAPPDLRPRIRDLGAEPGILPPGPLDAITDVVGSASGTRR